MKLFFKIFFLLTLFSFKSSFGQGETWNWYLGNNDGITFINGKYPKLIKLTTTDHWESNSAISDSFGELLLYSSANKILDKGGKVLIDTLKTHYSSSQGNLFLKHPKSENIFFFSTAASESYQYGTRMSIISPLKDSFIIKQANIAVYHNTAEKMNAVNHQNNNDIWIINHSENADTFYLFLLKKQGLICCPIKNKLGLVYNGNGLEGVAQIKFSPSGKKIINTTWYKNKTEVYEYDNETGTMTLKISIPSLFSVCSAFSCNENIIYVNENACNLVQYEIDKYYKYKTTVIKETDHELYNLQLGPDKKIYVVQINIGNYLSAITDPDSNGLKCGYNDSFLKLTKPKDTPGLPNFNQSYFYTPSIDYAYEQDCRTNTITFEGKDTIKATSYKWVFSKGAKMDSKTSKDASYTFADTGRWDVKYIARNGSRSDTVTKTITIRPRLEQGFLGEDIKLCKALPLKLDAPKNLHCIHWYNDSLLEIGKVDSIKITKPGTYYAKATNVSFCVEWDTIRIDTGIIKPKANFTMADVCVGDSAVFINKSKDGVSYSWKFGDGSIDTSFNPKHHYSNIITTTYNVTLTTQFRGGCADSLSKQITINAKPKSGFTYFTSGQIVSFTANETNANIYKWALGDRGNDTITNNPKTTHNYAKFPSGKYTACLRVTNLAGCVADSCREINISGGISSFALQNEIVIYPNPNKGRFTLNISKAGNYNLKVYNEIGQLVLEKSIKGNQDNTVLLKEAKGNYLIEMMDEDGGKIVKKVVVE